MDSKHHKHLSRASFIIAAPQYPVKTFSKALTSVFKLMYKQIETYNSKNNYLQGQNHFDQHKNPARY